MTAAQVVTGFCSNQVTYSERFGTFTGIGSATMTVSLLQVALPGSEHVVAFERYSLDRREGHAREANGVFSPVLHRIALGWLIAADHTS